MVHIAGTNGKGSLVAFLHAILEAAGLRVHVYTSPHLVRFNERIVVAGREIDDAALTAVLEQCEAANGGDPVTFFEITTAAALVAFAGHPADVTLLETGLGGRLDATNVVARPALCALTPISIDHQAYLGETLAAIAGEKAGILKPGVPCVVAAQRPRADAVIRARAAVVGAPLVCEGSDWTVRPVEGGPVEDGPVGDGMVFAEGDRRLRLPRPGLIGAHQIANAGLAVACVRRLEGVRVDEDAIGRGLRQVRWPARLQRLRGGRLRSLLADDWELWLDGGHNPAAGEVLAAQAETWRDRPLYAVVGMLRSKDAAGFLRPLASRLARMTAVPIPLQEGSCTAEDLAATAASLGIAATPAAGLAEALAGLAREASGPARVLVCGSLYLAGEVLRENRP